MLARRKERLDELCEELGDRAVGVPADVTDLDGLEAAIGEGTRLLGGLDAVVAVAGRAMAGGVVTGSPQAWRDLIDLNLVGPLATVRCAVPHFPETGRRNVVLVGSAAAITPMPGTSAYSASKAGLRAAFESMRLELAPDGISTTHVMPGMFETEGLTIEGIVIDGPVPENDFPLLVPGAAPGAPEVVARSIAFILSLPDGMAINEVVIRPTGQLNP
jgi:NADP-dependent 3-hydroxy acid dehydrogenase YdfG